MKRILFILSILGFMSFLVLNTNTVSAHCPLCTAAVGAGVVVTRFYGVSDSVVGIWIGAFVVSTALWLNKVLKKKLKKNIPFQGFAITGLGLISTIIPFHFTGLISNSNTIFGIDKLLLSILIGSAVTYAGLFVSSKLKKFHGKVFFPFQSIIIILLLLGSSSIILQFVG